MKMPNHTGDDSTGVTWPRCNLAVAESYNRVMLAAMLPSHAGDIDAELCWHGAAESCW
jgi:hypothetical protein